MSNESWESYSARTDELEVAQAAEAASQARGEIEAAAIEAEEAAQSMLAAIAKLPEGPARDILEYDAGKIFVAARALQG